MVSRRYEGKSGFQAIAIELHNQKKEHMRLVIDSIGVHVVVKIVDEIYVLSTFEIYSYCSFAFSIIIQNIL